MRKTFEEIGLELVPGATFGSFGGEVTYEWDAIGGEWYCALIRLKSDGGMATDFGLTPGMPQPYGKIFRLLETQLLERAADAGEDWYREPFREWQRRELGYGPMQHERV